MVDLLTPEASRNNDTNRQGRPTQLLAAAAAVALVAVVAVVLAQVRSTSTVDVVDDPTEVEQAFTSEDALGVADGYFAAISSGDFEELRALFAADARFRGIAANEKSFAWNAAQGTTLSPPECGVVAGTTAQTVSCRTFNHDALTQAVDGPPVPIRVTLTITPRGIVEDQFSFGDPDFNTVGIPFHDWMQANHPEDVDKVGFANWRTVEDAEQNGTLTAQYAREWGAYLESNGCAYDDGC